MGLVAGAFEGGYILFGCIKRGIFGQHQRLTLLHKKSIPRELM
jgi:hypothetical protein